MFSKSTNLVDGQNLTGFGKGSATAVYRAAFSQQQSSSLYFVCEIIEHLLFLWLRSVWPWTKVKVNTINTPVMHSQAWGSHRVMFDDDNLNSFQGIAGEGHTDRQTDTQTDKVWSIWNFSQSLLKLWKEKGSPTCTYVMAFLPSSASSTTRARPCSLRYWLIQWHMVRSPFVTRKNNLYMHAKSGRQKNIHVNRKSKEHTCQ